MYENASVRYGGGREAAVYIMNILLLRDKEKRRYSPHKPLSSPTVLERHKIKMEFVFTWLCLLLWEITQLWLKKKKKVQGGKLRAKNMPCKISFIILRQPWNNTLGQRSQSKHTPTLTPLPLVHQKKKDPRPEWLFPSNLISTMFTTVSARLPAANRYVDRLDLTIVKL